MITALITRLGQTAYGLYAWLIFLIIIPLTVIGVVIVPGLRSRRRVARSGARCVFWAIGAPIACNGSEVLDNFPCIVVANHASYLDGIVLTAALPPHFTFVIKSEMSEVPVASLLLRRLSSEFVARHDTKKRVRAARRLVRAAKDGDPLVFFPEGTFDRQPGLKRFRPGAFSAAMRGSLPVVPVIIRGTRRMLPSDSWLPRLARIEVLVETPLDSSTFDNAQTLGNAARRQILAKLGEPDRG